MEHVDYQSPDLLRREARIRRIKRRSASVALAFGSFSLLAFGIFALGERTMASTMFGDWFFAIALAAVPVIVGFPILVGVGFLLRWIVEGTLHRPLRRRRYWPWLAPALFGLGCAAASFLLYRTPRGILRDFPKIEMPASLSNFKCWRLTLPGDSLYILRFDINPTDFNKLLANHKFVQDSNAFDVHEALKGDFPVGLVGSNMQLPQASLAVVYKFSTESPPGLPHILEVYTTADRHEILICGDN